LGLRVVPKFQKAGATGWNQEDRVPYKVKHGKATTKITYRRARFSRDVAVSGVASLDIATSRLTGRITVAGALPGTLQLHATLWDPDKPNATVRGTLGGQRVALLAPAR
jgi:hypothetical protein